MTIRRTLSVIALAALCSAPVVARAQSKGADQKPTTPAPASASKAGAPVNADAAALVDFKKRIDTYLALHQKVAKSSPPLKQTDDPAEITRAQNALFEALRAARADAKAGDIFTPEIRASFRKILRPELKGEDGADAKAILKDDAPASVPLKVNAKYPEGATRPTVPVALLANLPKLPEEVEYRIVDGHLVLLDTKAWMVIDFIPNALPKSS